MLQVFGPVGDHGVGAVGHRQTRRCAGRRIDPVHRRGLHAQGGPQALVERGQGLVCPVNGAGRACVGKAQDAAIVGSGRRHDDAARVEQLVLQQRLKDLARLDVVDIEPGLVAALAGRDVDDVRIVGETDDRDRLAVLGVPAEVFSPFAAGRIADPLGEIDRALVVVQFLARTDLALEVQLETAEPVRAAHQALGHA